VRGAIRRAVEEAVRETTGRAIRITGSSPVGGGCIHDARILELENGGRLFLKSNATAPDDLFPTEAEGLRALAAVGAIRVPRDPVPGRAGDVSFLVMEAIPTGRPRPGFFEVFGRSFAALHRRSAEAHGTAPGGGRFGFPHDNYLGATPQPNGWMDDWVELFRTRRLGHQLDLARRRGLSDAELERLGERLLERLGDWLDAAEEPACLLHGDLWSGNFLADAEGEPVLVDPAAYYGHREADLAMTELFGGFDAAFYAAYEEAWPLPPGSPERRRIYKLYHLLNHLNLFGRGYRDGCVAILRRLA